MTKYRILNTTYMSILEHLQYFVSETHYNIIEIVFKDSIQNIDRKRVGWQSEVGDYGGCGFRGRTFRQRTLWKGKSSFRDVHFDESNDDDVGNRFFAAICNVYKL